MTLIVEDGTGVARANSYTGLGFASSYHSDRGNTSWASATTAARRQALIAATDYIDRRWGPRMKGRREFLSKDFKANGFLELLDNTLNNQTFTIGSTTYTLVNSLSGADEVLIGAATGETADNIVAAVNGAAGEGSTYGTGTTANADATAARVAGQPDVFVEAKTAGEDGNDIATTTSDADKLVFDQSTLTGGTLDGSQALEFPRIYLYDRAGRVVEDIPVKLQQATAEYALQALSASLFVEPTIDARGQAVQRKRERVGPIEEETEYAEGSRPSVHRPWPKADKLLTEYLTPSGKLIRA